MRIIIILVFLGVVHFLNAQQRVTIPFRSVQVKEDLKVDKSIKNYWICPEVALAYGGGNGTIHVEPMGSLMLFGGTPTVYLKKGSVVEVFGGSPKLYFEEELNLINHNKVNVRKPIKCDNIQFLYTETEHSKCPSPSYNQNR